MPVHFGRIRRQDRASQGHPFPTRPRRIAAVCSGSHYYLCGFDTFGFAMFQCLVLTAAGELQLLCRTPYLRQAQQTSTLGDSPGRIARVPTPLTICASCWTNWGCTANGSAWKRKRWDSPPSIGRPSTSH